MLHVWRWIREWCMLKGQVWILFHGWSGYVFFAGVQGLFYTSFSTRALGFWRRGSPVISQMRIWAMYRSRKLLMVMSIFVCLALVVMGVIEGLGYSHMKGRSYSQRPDLFWCPMSKPPSQSHLWTPSLGAHLWPWPPTPLCLCLLVCGFLLLHNSTHKSIRIPPLLVEFVSVIFVIHKAILHFQGASPMERVGSRALRSILRYSVVYFIV